MIPSFVIEHYAWKKNISIAISQNYHQKLELFLNNSVLGIEKSPSIEVDDVWHNFILHTRLYANYCKDEFGVFIHHNPHINKSKQCDSSIEKPKEDEDARCDGFTSNFKDCDAGGTHKNQDEILDSFNSFNVCESDSSGSETNCDSQFAQIKTFDYA